MAANTIKSRAERVSSAPALSKKPADVTVRNRVEIPILDGALRADFVSFHGLPDRKDHFAVCFAQSKAMSETPLVRLHSECMTGDLFGSLRCDCGPQLQEAIMRLNAEGGVLLYLRQEGRGIGLAHKLDAYLLQDSGADTYEANLRLGLPADARDYSIAVAMLKALGIAKLRLLSNNPDKASQLEAGGIAVVGRIPTGTFVQSHNRRYLAAKRTLGGHSLDQQTIEGGR